MLYFGDAVLRDDGKMNEVMFLRNGCDFGIIIMLDLVASGAFQHDPILPGIEMTRITSYNNDSAPRFLGALLSEKSRSHVRGTDENGDFQLPISLHLVASHVSFMHGCLPCRNEKIRQLDSQCTCKKGEEEIFAVEMIVNDSPT